MTPGGNRHEFGGGGSLYLFANQIDPTSKMTETIQNAFHPQPNSMSSPRDGDY
jgi:hypothetical protein